MLAIHVAQHVSNSLRLGRVLVGLGRSPKSQPDPILDPLPENQTMSSGLLSSVPPFRLCSTAGPRQPATTQQPRNTDAVVGIVLMPQNESDTPEFLGTELKGHGSGYASLHRTDESRVRDLLYLRTVAVTYGVPRRERTGFKVVPGRQNRREPCSSAR